MDLLPRPQLQKILCKNGIAFSMPYNAAEYEAKFAESEKLRQKMKKIEDAHPEVFKKNGIYCSTKEKALREKKVK